MDSPELESIGAHGKMKAVILVGGKGTRLLPLTCNLPKPMVPVLNQPFMEYVIEHLSQHGVREIIMAMNYLPDAIATYFGSGAAFDSHIIYEVEKTPMDTAGAVKNCEDHCDGAFFVLNGDIFTDLDLKDMIRFHRSKKAKATICLTPVADPTAYGLIETDRGGRVTRFLEKPKPEEITTNMINAGTYILELDVLNHIPRDTPFSFERKLFPTLLESGVPVYAYPSDAYWIDIGRPEKYHQLNRDLLKNRRKKTIIGEGCQIHPSAKLRGAVVIGAGCAVGENAVIQDSVIWRNVQIEAGAMIKGSLVADGCHLKQGCRLEEAILGEHVTIGEGAKVGRGSKLWPYTVIEPGK
ncbi:MAG: NDP-sugar synthase [Chloroflexota bacterium]